MARIRTIKPEFFTDEDVCDLPPLVRIFFVGMWCQADKAGRLKDQPRQLKARIMPFDKLDGETAIAKLVDSGFVVRYSIDEKPYLQIRTWVTHQRPHHTEQGSCIPPCNNGAITVQQPLDNGRKGREGKGKEGKEEGGRAAPFTPPTVDEVRAYMLTLRYGSDPEQFVAFYTANGWVQGNGKKPIKDWKAAVVNWEKNHKSGRFGDTAPTRPDKPINGDWHR